MTEKLQQHSLVEIEPYPLSKCAVLKRVHRSGSKETSRELSRISERIDLHNPEWNCSCGDLRHDTDDENRRKKHHRYGCRNFKRVMYTEWGRSKRHVLLSIPRPIGGRGRAISANEPHVSLEELLLQQSQAKNKEGVREMVKIETSMSQRVEPDRKYFRYSRELEKRAMRECNLEDILVERLTRYDPRRPPVEVPTAGTLSGSNEEGTARYYPESRQGKLIQEMPPNNHGSNMSQSDNNTCLRISLSRLGMAGVGGGKGSQMGTNRSESKLAAIAFGSRPMVVEKRITVPTPLTREPVTFDHDFN
ncbi:uncharacterized protein LOC134856538 isoform X2 [Symsagittifera roscoffensis]|uniref:uncharacterized protein LOC134856538 isoform X2 n=1 Tax=Symsagittifera roscoffensis TaxID=84072 RepID=UPI00307C0F88